MIWSSLLLLALCSATPDPPAVSGESSVESSLILSDSTSRAGWLFPARDTTSNTTPDASIPTAAPTMHLQQHSRRTASNLGPSSTSAVSSVASDETSGPKATTTDSLPVTSGITSREGDNTNGTSSSDESAGTPPSMYATEEHFARDADAAGDGTRHAESVGGPELEGIVDGQTTSLPGTEEQSAANKSAARLPTIPSADVVDALNASPPKTQTDPADAKAPTANGTTDSVPSVPDTHREQAGSISHADRPVSSPISKPTAPAADNDTAAPLSNITTKPASAPSQPTKAPGKHKYNYASPDCGARVQASSPSSQHASGVLHKSRDRYMLTPCKANQHWVTIELCDEIRVEAVEVSVWEYFSGVVREVKVSVITGGDGDDGDEGEGEMEEVGMFVGRNVRGAQTFTLPNPTSFSRFIRVDFPSYYGSEYYCPVSQIKVYGMNQLEAYKWEQKQVSSSSTSAKQALETARIHPALNQSTERNDTNDTASMGELEKLVHAAARSARDPLPSAEEILSSSNGSTAATATADKDKEKPRRDRSDSESIYAFITRRLADLEGNSTLVLRYIDEQTRLLRRAQDDMYAWRAEQDLRDAQRWESERMRQEDRLGRIVSQLEAQRADRSVLDAKLRVLEEQLSHERRRGFAQLGVLMMVIAIGAATRSETIERLMKPLLAEAGRRKRRFTFSSDLRRKNREGGGAAMEQDVQAEREEWKDDAFATSIAMDGVSRSNSMGHKRSNGGSGTPTSLRRRSHRPDHHHAPRSSLPAHARYTPRKLARTSHLHPMLGGLVSGQQGTYSDNTGSTDGSPYAQSPLSPLGPHVG